MRRYVALAVGCAVLVACTDGGSNTSAASTSAAASSSTAVVEDSVITRYLAALDQGDYAGANALRCTQGRVRDDLMSLFQSEVEAVKAAAGGRIELLEATIVEPITLGSLMGERPDSQVAFSLATPDGPTSLLALAVVTQDGEPRLCGEMQEGSPGVQSDISASTITPMEVTLADLATALPDEIVAGAVQVDDSEVADLSQVPGALAGWTRAWSVPGGGVRVTLFRTDSADAAASLGLQILSGPGLDSAEHLTDLPNGFQGVSAVSAPWTWVHPASIGSRVDTAAGAAGDVSVVVEVTGARAGASHDVITEAVTNLSFA